MSQNLEKIKFNTRRKIKNKDKKTKFFHTEI